MIVQREHLRLEQAKGNSRVAAAREAKGADGLDGEPPALTFEEQAR